MATFFEVSKVFQKIEETASRNEITQILADFYATLQPREAQIFSYLLLGRVAPMFISSEFNYSEKGLIKVLGEIANLKEVNMDISKIREKTGDIGLTAEKLITEVNSKPASISLEDFYEELWGLVNISGTGSTQAKAKNISNLLADTKSLEAKYLCRIITGKLRLGASDRTVLDAFSYLLAGDKSERDNLESYYGVNSDLGAVAHSVVGLKSAGKAAFSQEVVPTPGIPIRSRLVERVKEFQEVFDRLGESFYVQSKYDGIRCQAHKGVDYSKFDRADAIWMEYLDPEDPKNDASIDMFSSDDGGEKVDKASQIRLFSRNLEDITLMFPEIVEALIEVPMESFIIDCEVVGWDQENETFVPFQETMTRKRKYDIKEARSKVPVRLYMFDLLSLNGENIMDKDLDKRVEIMSSNFQKSFKDPLFLTQTDLIKSTPQLEEHFNIAVEDGLEGLIVKQEKGAYQPGKRNFEWLKLKKSMDKALVDTVDVVIMGYYYGSGKKTQFGMGALLGGIVDSDGNIRSITKIGTGITDDQWEKISKKLKKFEVAEKPKIYLVNSDLEPDQWVLPDVVASVEADEITVSKVHTAGLGSGDKGYALRFPRLIEFDRDKDHTDATSESELLQIKK